MVTVLDGWGTGPWEKQLYDGWTQGIAKALPDLKVEFIMTGGFTGGSTAKTLAMIAAGTPPDLTLGSDVSFALKGALVDLKSYFDQDKEIGGWKWYPPCWQLVNIVLDNGHPMLWAFPGNSDARVIYMNLDLLQKAGVTYDPAKQWDWTAFEDAAKRLTNRQGGNIQQLGFSGLWTFGDPYVLAQYAGGDYFAIDKASGWVNKATFGAPGTQAGLAYFRKLMVEDKVGQLPNDKFSGGFTAGTVAMQPAWTSFLSSLNPTTNPKLQQFKWDVAGFPVMKAGDKWPNQFANGSQMGSLVQGSKNLTGAYQVGKYLIGAGHVVRMQAMGAPPIIINNDQQQQVWKQRGQGTRYTATYDAVMSQGSIGTWSKIKANSDQIMKLYGDNITKLLNGQLAVSDFGATMDSSVNPLLTAS
jgi:ABC-type glycerol-3-phosphate transport system substrate-binding protein